MNTKGSGGAIIKQAKQEGLQARRQNHNGDPKFLLVQVCLRGFEAAAGRHRFH